MAAVIHHSYRSFHIYYRDRHYRVCHDKQPELADEHLHHHSLNAAKRYVDVCCDIVYGFVMEPHKSLMLLPFYLCGHRSDGPLPAALQLVMTSHPAPTDRCAHVWCNVNHANMHGGSIWQYCGQRVLRGSTRCIAHSI